jgi:hypothetical protein
MLIEFLSGNLYKAVTYRGYGIIIQTGYGVWMRTESRPMADFCIGVVEVWVLLPREIITCALLPYYCAGVSCVS